MPVRKTSSTKKKKVEEKPVPIRCKCGLYPCIVKLKGGYVVSCRDPVNCVGNFMTYKKSTEDGAVLAWNDLIRYGYGGEQ
jgi:hypothetical protein